MKSKILDIKNMKRSYGLCIALTVMFALLVLRILIYQTVNHKEYEQKVLDQMTQESNLTADRGEIYDRNGVLLATNITTYRLLIDPSVIHKESEKDGVDYAEIIAKGISEITALELDKSFILQQTEYVKYRDRTLKRHLSEELADSVRNFLESEGIANKGFVFLQATSKRYYPNGTLAAHVLGFTNNEGDGIYGLEAKYNQYLKGEDGKYITAKDSFGNEIPYDYESFIAAVDGDSITVTIDVVIQAELEEQLKTAYIESGGHNRATGMVVDVNTGDVLAMAVYPAFDANDPYKLDEYSQAELDASGFAEGTQEYDDLRSKLLTEMWSNKAITDPYMPGSTFKIITAAMAYEENLVNNSEYFSCPGYHIVNGTKIKCHKTSGHGTLNFPRGIQQSCNPVLMQMGAKIGAEKFYNYFESFGYFANSGIDLPGESHTIPGVTFWDKETFTGADIYLATASFGQNFNVSVTQHMAAISAVANGGYLVEPHFIKEIKDANGNTVFTYEDKVKRQVISQETCDIIGQVLNEGVETDGGAKNAYVAGYKVAAKTGTSEKKKNENDTVKCTKCSYESAYQEFDIELRYKDLICPKCGTNVKLYVCSTVAYAPANDPKIATIILVDEPTKGTLYGSVLAAPYVGNLLSEALPYYGVAAEYSDKELEKLALETPTVLYWSTGVAKEFAETVGFEVEIVGDGNLVVGQSPAAGVKVEPGGAKIILYTSREQLQNKEMVRVPDLMGMTAVAANGTLANCGLNIRISGTKNYMSGTGAVVVSQSVNPGELVEKGTVIEVTFRYLDAVD